MCDEREDTFKEESDGQRPLKKARYVWQVKGKYHLKESSETQKDSAETEASAEGTSKRVKESEVLNNNAAPNKNSAQCGHMPYLEIFVEQSNKIINSLVNNDRSAADDIPVTMVKPNTTTDDFYLRKWQARQVAKGFVDNTINKVLENWVAPPFDPTDFVENCDNDGQIEDEGILMAIQSHGLQSGNINSIDSSNSVLKKTNTSCTCSHFNENPLTGVQVPFHRRDDSVLYSFENVQNQLLHGGDASRNQTDVIRNETSSGNGTKRVIVDDKNSNSDCVKTDDQSDFLDAAVAVAIQKKGLSSYSYG